MYNFYKDFLDERKLSNNFRELNSLNLENFLDFTDNDYLSLKNSKFFKKELIKNIKQHPLSVSSSRLIYNGDLFEKLEKHLSHAFDGESCLIFSSGFQLNQSVISAILDKKIVQDKIIFSDKLNHASIYEGINFQKNDKLIRYKNCDLEELDNLLQKYSNIDNKFVFTESIFSMDGTILDIQKIIELKKKHNFFLIVDDCHATGIFGQNGYGLCEKHGKEIDIIIGSLSKAIPSQGAFMICNKIIKDFIVNKAKGFIYSSALSLVSLFIAEIFFFNIDKFNKQRKKLLNNCRYFISKLEKIIINSNQIKHHKYDLSPIIPVIIGSNVKLDILQKAFKKQNILITKIKSPTVPQNTERIRFTIKSEHSYSNIDSILNLIISYS